MEGAKGSVSCISLVGNKNNCNYQSQAKDQTTLWYMYMKWSFKIDTDCKRIRRKNLGFTKDKDDIDFVYTAVGPLHQHEKEQS